MTKNYYCDLLLLSDICVVAKHFAMGQSRIYHSLPSSVIPGTVPNNPSHFIKCQDLTPLLLYYCIFSFYPKRFKCPSPGFIKFGEKFQILQPAGMNVSPQSINDKIKEVPETEDNYP